MAATSATKAAAKPAPKKAVTPVEEKPKAPTVNNSGGFVRPVKPESRWPTGHLTTVFRSSTTHQTRLYARRRAQPRSCAVLSSPTFSWPAPSHRRRSWRQFSSPPDLLDSSLFDHGFLVGRGSAINQKPRPVLGTSEPRRRPASTAPCHTGLGVAVHRLLRTLALALARRCTSRLRSFLDRSLCFVSSVGSCSDDGLSAILNQEFAAVLRRDN